AAGMPARPGEAWMNAEHTFSHIHWNLRVFRFAAEDAAGQAENDEAENDVAVTGGTDGMTGSAEAAYGQAPYAGASVAAPNSVPYAGNADSAAQHQAAAGSAGLFAAETAAAYEAEANQAGEASASTGWAEQEAASPAGDGVKQAGFDLAADSAEYRWITKEDMGSLAFPNVFLRILNRYFKQV
ncbi:hypothetical protein P4H87_24440, partial [Paenibacillus macerans]|nr:hypothetical protein [Paenibacillus macerans]